jgi:uncharacterized protein (TIGR02453 family)
LIIPPELYEFLEELKANNQRSWFESNRGRYQEVYLEPLLDFIQGFSDRLLEISPYYRAIPRATGGSLFRIYRDLRFARDKRPYKTWAGMHFRHEGAQDVHSPGFYLHLEPDNNFVSCGIWRPETKTQYRIRRVIAEHPQRWLAAISEPAFIAAYQLVGDSLIRTPRGFDSDHPLIEDLKRKDFLASHPITRELALRKDFLDQYTNLCKIAIPFMRFLTESLGLPW